MDILRIATSGSVDDGKSTLIGRLLFETKSITKDKIEALELASKRKGLDFIDLSLLTDGLIAEREQGITIDVAYIYFNTQNRKYIIADTPGHIEYTRNMVTGISNCSATIILIDARKGVIEQTKRHFYLAATMQIKNIVIAINKMDLVNYDQAVFENIKKDFFEATKNLKIEDQEIRFVPLSSLYGENITTNSEKMPWYKDNNLLEILEQIPVSTKYKSEKGFRFAVQSVIRPKKEEFHDFRGYAGRIASGKIKVGDEIKTFPNNGKSKIKSISRGFEKLNEAFSGQSVVIELEDDIDISRGNMIAKSNSELNSGNEITATVCWLDSDQLNTSNRLLLQHGVNRQKAKVTEIVNKIDINNLEEIPSDNHLKLNEIGKIKVKLGSPIFADKYDDNPSNGSFILIDDNTNHTVAVGLIS